MIEYRNDVWLMCLVFRLRGSVLSKAAPYAMSNAMLAMLLHWGARQYVQRFSNDANGDGIDDFLQQLDKATSIWAGYTALLGVLVVFRNNQAYSRFWEGATLIRQIRGEWFNCVSGLIAFCSRDKARTKQVRRFQQLLVRLTSILHCSALQQVCELDEEKLQVLDLTELSQEHLRYLEEVPDRILVLVQWLQRLIVDSDAAGTICIPAPVLSRTFSGVIARSCKPSEPSQD